MIIGLGLDQVEIERVRRIWQRYGERFRRRVYTQSEWDYCLSQRYPAPSLAGRFAAKEAAMKALGRGWPGGVCYCDIEVTRERSGRPGLRFTSTAAQRAQAVGLDRAVVSLTHDCTFAMATVIFERD